MPGFIQVRTRPVATAGVPFRCTVLIVGACPGETITIRLAQTAGCDPPYSCSAEVPIAADGTGVAIFDDVVVHGPGSEARFVADDVASSAPLAAGDAHIRVVQP